MRLAITNSITVVLGAAVLVACGSTSGQQPLGTSPSSATSGSATALGPTQTGSTSSSAGRSPSSSPSHAQSPSGTLVLTRQGLGGVPVGATLSRFAQALGRTPTPMSATEKATFAERQCALRRLDGLTGVAFMVIDDDPVGTVRMIGVGEGSHISTDTGIRLGAHLDEVRAIYGQGLNEPFDHYPVGGQAVLVRADANSGVYWAFIGDQGDQVVDFRLGLKPEVLSPEGCS